MRFPPRPSRTPCHPAYYEGGAPPHPGNPPVKVLIRGDLIVRESSDLAC